MAEEITIKKQDLWKYSTFVLLALVVVGGFFFLTGHTIVNNTTTQDQNTGTQQALTLTESTFSDTTLYPSLGPKTAKNTVIEFSDFQCPYCGMASGLTPWIDTVKGTQYADLIDAARNVQDMAKQGKIRFVYVSMSFLGQESVYAAEAGMCANEQGKFWEMHDALFKAQTATESDGKFNKDKLEAMAKTITGIDSTKFNSCLESDKYGSSVQKIGQAASSSGVTGTPMFFVNGQQVPSSNTAIQAALA